MLGLALALAALDAHTADAGEQHPAGRLATLAPDAPGTGRRLRTSDRRQSSQPRVLPGVAITVTETTNLADGLLRVSVGSRERVGGDSSYRASMEIGELQRGAEGSGRAYAAHGFSENDVDRLLKATQDLDTALQPRTSPGDRGEAADRQTILARLAAKWIRGQVHHALASRNAEAPKSYYRRTAAPIAATNMLDQLVTRFAQEGSTEILHSPAVARAVLEAVRALEFNPLVRASRGLDPSDTSTDFGTFVATLSAEEGPWKEVVEAARQHPTTPALEPSSRW